MNDNNKSELILNLDKLHTTDLGIKRIKRNLCLDVNNVVNWCGEKIKEPNSSIIRRGKNWYVNVADYEITFITHLLGADAGTVFLAKSGILNNVKYTTPAVEWTEKHIKIFGEKDPFPRKNFVQKRVVRDRNIITAQGIAF